MNEYQTKIFTELMQLCATNEAFFFKDTPLDDSIFRVFTYRLASYSDFLLPSARECRGIMFEVDKAGNPVRLACLTPSKFFNLGENPLTIGLDLSADNVDGIMDKMDGSIISTFIHKGQLRLKSKTSLSSEHVAMAMSYLQRPENEAFAVYLQGVTNMGYSIHMELTSPVLRIVLGYQDINLTILSGRNVYSGDLLVKQDIQKFGECNPLTVEFLARWVPEFKVDDVETFVAGVPAMTGIEGYVIRLNSGEHVKLKCDWYCVLHHTKDSVSSPRRLFECIVNEAADDLKAMFVEDPITLKRIAEMEGKVTKQYNHMLAEISGFYEENKDLDRKSYAIKAQGCANNLMGLKMSLYLKRPIDFKEFAIKHPELFNINKDEVYEDVVVE